MSGGVDDAFVTEVRERSDIVAVVGDYVTLKKAGNQYKGLCPFHAEKTPSLNVNPARQLFYCFGCQTGGDVITFVRELNGYSFVEALRHLGERAGLALPEQRAHEPGRGARRTRRLSREQRGDLYAIGGLAQRFFAASLDAMEGGVCRAYLQERGITRETARRFGLGYAPNRWDGLLDHLRDEEADLRRAESLGLIAKRKSGDGAYDRFRDRLIFPIRSIAGEIIAFGGRRLSSDKETPKYINSPESPIYAKGDTLFGLHEARAAMRARGRALIVEGNIDLLKLAQEGFEHVVAPMGTALTEAQCRLLKRFVPRAVALFDGDDAGRAAAEKAVGEALAQGLAIAVATLPAGEDPDSFVAAHGSDALAALIDDALPGWEYAVMRAVDRHEAHRELAGKVRALDELAPLLERVDDRRERTLYVRHLQGVLGIDEPDLVRLLRDSLRRGARRGARVEPAADSATQAPPPLPPPPRPELALLELLLLAPETVGLYMAHDAGSLLTHEGVKRAAERLQARWEDEVEIDLATTITALEDPQLERTLFRDLTAGPAARPDDPQAAFETLLRGLRRADCERRIVALRHQERRAFATRDEDAALRMQMERLELERALERIKSPALQSRPG